MKQTDEITLTLMEDLRAAIQNVLNHVMPTLHGEARIITSPKLGIYVDVNPEDARYPYFVEAQAVIKLTKKAKEEGLLYVPR